MKRTYPSSLIRFRWVAILPLLLLTNACIRTTETPLEMTLEVKTSGRPGVYLASGTTNLPDRSKLAISGIRYLQPTNDITQSAATNTTYSILAREVVEVAQGKWETNLSLWQVASDGRYVEAWQLNQPTAETAYKPDPRIVFTAVFEPGNQLPEVNQKIGKISEQSGRTLMRFTESGQRYFQVSEALSISTPVGRTSIPANNRSDTNDGWGNRNTSVETSATRSAPIKAPKDPQTDAPLTPAELAR